MTDKALQAALDQIDRAFGKHAEAGEAAMRRQLAAHPEVDAPKDLVDLGFEIVGFVSQFADEGTSVDRGCGMGQFDCQVTIGGVEYSITVTASDENDE